MTTRGLRVGPPVVVAVAVLVSVVAPAGAVVAPAGAELGTASGHAPDPDCGGTGGGAAYTTDSGLTVFENDSDIAFGTYPDDETVDFGSIVFSAAGPASVRLENGTGATTCVAAVDATANGILVAPDGENNVTVSGNLTDLWFRDVDYTPGDDTADVAYAASEPVDLEVADTGLAPGTTVIAEAIDGTRFGTATVADDGSVGLSLPAETHRVDVRRARPANFAVTIDSTTAPVEEDEPLTVTATVANVGELEGTRNVTLTVGERERDVGEVTLGGGERRTVELTWSTGSGDAGNYTATIDAEDDSASMTVTVRKALGADGGAGDGSPTPTTESPTPTTGETTGETTGATTGATTTTTARAGGGGLLDWIADNAGTIALLLLLLLLLVLGYVAYRRYSIGRRGDAGESSLQQTDTDDGPSSAGDDGPSGDAGGSGGSADGTGGSDGERDGTGGSSEG